MNEQLKLAIKSKPIYPSSVFLWASTIHLQFPGSYRLLIESQTLTLPHPKYLNRLTADMKCDIGLKASQIAYLKKKCANLEAHERFVNVLFDEIHIRPKLEYRGGRLVGAATEQKLIANKIQAFMLTSIY